MKTIAIIVAGGSGSRFGAKKQFIEINEKPLYYYSVKAFSGIADHIILVVPKEDVDSIEPYEAIVIAGGKNRYDSVYNGIKKLEDIDGYEPDEGDIVMIHDGARPMITKEVIDRVLEDTKHHTAAVATVPVVDTIRTVDGRLLDRTKLRAMQTPQAFKYGLLKLAYEMFMSLPEEKKIEMKVTDDVQVLKETLGMDSYLSEGDPQNIKVTTPSDVEFLHLS